VDIVLFVKIYRQKHVYFGTVVVFFFFKRKQDLIKKRKQDENGLNL